MVAKNVPPGPGVDSTGQTVVDPTKNVLDLVRAESRRQDDLRSLEFKAIRNEIKISLNALRRELRDFKDYLEKIGIAESKRIDAIRAVDIGNVATARVEAETRASTLAGQVSTVKDAQMAALKTETDPLRKDIGDLRQSQWTLAGGREQIVETRDKNNNWAIWVGVGVAILGIVVSGFLVTAGIVVTYLISR